MFSKLWQTLVVFSLICTSLVWAKVTIYLVGDSTMQDWAAGYYPKQGMGQDFGYFFDSGLATVFNAGRGGTTSLSYYDGFWKVRGTDRNGKYVFDKAIKDMVQSGDYVMIMIGANDNGYKTGEENFKNSVTAMVNETKAKGANPILISPIRRSDFRGQDSIYESYHAYPIYMRDLARDLKVPFIDLDTLSRNYLLSLGQYYSNHYLNMFIDSAEYSTTGVQTDNQHLQQTGANAFGRIVTEQLRVHSDAKTKELANYLRPMYQVDIKVSPEGSSKATTVSTYYPEGMMVTLKTTPKEGGPKFVGWFDGNGNKVSGNAMTNVLSPYIYTFKMGNKSTQFTAVYEGGSAVLYTGNGGAVTNFSAGVPKQLKGLPFQPEGYVSAPAEEEKKLGPIEFLSSFEGEDLDAFDVGWVESDHQGFSGEGYWNFDNNLNTFASHKLVFPKAQTVTLGIIYANGGTGDRMINAYLDHDYYVSCPPTGAWNNWDTVYTEIMLPYGESSLDFISLTADGGPNIDRFGFDIEGITRVNAKTEEPIEPDSTDKIITTSLNGLRIQGNMLLGTRAGMGSVSVYNLKGKRIFEEQVDFKNGATPLSLNRIQKMGVYLIEVKSPGVNFKTLWKK